MKLLAIDGNSILNRAFYGIRPLSNTQGVFTHAIFGFMNIYLKNRDEVQPDAVVVAFDLRKPTFRHKAVATYKANRKGMPEELAMQLPYVKQLLTLLGIPVITCEGYEADDILGTLAAACTAQDADCVILTGDRDSLQLVSDHVTVRLTTNKETIPYTPERFQEEYGFAPLSLIDLKALMGDSSDNISGVAGVGQKTASKLIQAWGTVENLYAHLDEAGLTKSVYNKLTAGQDAAKESKWLATIVTDVPIDMDVQHYLPQPVQTEEVRRLLLELEMAKLLEKLKLSGTDTPAAEAAEPAEQQQPLTEQPLTAALLDTWCADKTELPCCLFDGSRICVYHAGTPEAVYTSADTALWEQLFQMPRLTFGAKPQYRFLLAQGITPDSGSPAAKDAELAAYLLNSTTSAYEVERLCVTYHVPYPRSAGEYADLAALPKLYAAMEKLVEEQGMTRLLHFEQQLTVVLAAMEHDGIAIDRQGVEDFGVYLSEQIEEMQQMVYDEAGHTFNIGSPKQLGNAAATRQKDQDRLFHQCGHSGKTAGRICHCRLCAEMAAVCQAEIHLCGRIAENRWGRRQNPHRVQTDRNPYRANLLHRAESPEYSCPHRTGTEYAKIFRGTGGLCAAGRRLQPDRTAAAGKPERRPADAGGIP